MKDKSWVSILSNINIEHTSQKPPFLSSSKGTFLATSPVAILFAVRAPDLPSSFASFP
jgi:hypothetical protein